MRRTVPMTRFRAIRLGLVTLAMLIVGLGFGKILSHARAAVTAPGEAEPVFILAAGAPAGSSEGVIPGEAVVRPPAESHAWFVVPGMHGQAVVLHVPPRRFASAEDGKLRGSADGTLRRATVLDGVPSAIAAWGDRLYFLEDRPPGIESTKRKVSSLRAARTGIGDLWSTLPEGGLETHPNLMGDGELMSFVGSNLGPVALLMDRSRETDRDVLRLVMLVDRTWVEVSVPEDAAEVAFGGALGGTGSGSGRGAGHGSGFGSGRGASPWAMLVSSTHELQLLVGSAKGTFRWSLKCDRDFAVEVRQSRDDAKPGEQPSDRVGDRVGDRAGAEAGGTSGKSTGTGASAHVTEPTASVVRVSWSARESLCPKGLEGRGYCIHKPTYAGLVAGRLVVLTEQGLLLHLKEWTGAEWRDVQDYDLEPDAMVAAVAPLDGVGRLAIAWPEAPARSPELEGGLTDGGKEPVKPAAIPGGEARHRLLEVSVYSGREMFSGRWKLVSPLGQSDLRILALALVAAMSLVVGFVLRAESLSGEVTLPAGTELAGLATRSVATLIDFGVALVIASQVHAMTLSEVFSTESLLNGRGVWAILTALAVAAVVGAACDSFFGKTFGKLITGCEVVSVRPGAGEDARAGVGALVFRNLLKWALPPIGLMSLLDAQGRHPADRLTRTAVVVRVDEEERPEG